MTYDDIDHALRTAQRLHRLTHDPMLLSAKLLLIPYLEHPSEAEFGLKPQATLAHTCIQRLEEARITLFGYATPTT